MQPSLVALLIQVLHVSHKTSEQVSQQHSDETLQQFTQISPISHKFSQILQTLFSQFLQQTGVAVIVLVATSNKLSDLLPLMPDACSVLDKVSPVVPRHSPY